MSRRRSASVTSSHLTNASTKAVLFERNVEIKDLESKVKYLQNKIKVKCLNNVFIYKKKSSAL